MSIIELPGEVGKKLNFALPRATPEEVAMSKKRLARITPTMRYFVDANLFPRITTVIARHGKLVHFKTQGLARIVEVITDQCFSSFLKGRLFDPLDMVDTDFFVPMEKTDRFAELYEINSEFTMVKPNGANIASRELMHQMTYQAVMEQ